MFSCKHHAVVVFRFIMLNFLYFTCNTNPLRLKRPSYFFSRSHSSISPSATRSNCFSVPICRELTEFRRKKPVFIQCFWPKMPVTKCYVPTFINRSNAEPFLDGHTDNIIMSYFSKNHTAYSKVKILQQSGKRMGVAKLSLATVQTIVKVLLH